MTHARQIRLGGLTLLVTIGLAVLLQTTLEAFWFYRARPAGKAGVVHDLMVIWPNFAILMIPLVVGAVFCCCGWYRRGRMTTGSDRLV